MVFYLSVKVQDCWGRTPGPTTDFRGTLKTILGSRTSKNQSKQAIHIQMLTHSGIWERLKSQPLGATIEITWCLCLSNMFRRLPSTADKNNIVGLCLFSGKSISLGKEQLGERLEARPSHKSWIFQLVATTSFYLVTTSVIWSPQKLFSGRIYQIWLDACLAQRWHEPGNVTILEGL